MKLKDIDVVSSDGNVKYELYIHNKTKKRDYLNNKTKNIYLTTKLNINVGDWFIISDEISKSYGEIKQCNVITDEYFISSKIIASTEDLSFNDNRIPNISNSFVNDYYEKEDIDKIIVDFENGSIKLDSNNNVILKCLNYEK